MAGVSDEEDDVDVHLLDEERRDGGGYRRADE